MRSSLGRRGRLGSFESDDDTSVASSAVAGAMSVRRTNSSDPTDGATSPDSELDGGNWGRSRSASGGGVGVGYGRGRSMSMGDDVMSDVSDDEMEDDVYDRPDLASDVTVHDMRVLYTIEMRDAIMLFVNKLSSLTATTTEDDTEDAPKTRDSRAYSFEDSGGQDDQQLAKFFNVAAGPLSGSPEKSSEQIKHEKRAEQAPTVASLTLAAETARKMAMSKIMFRARFLNPQINLLCPKTKGSVLLGFAEGELVSRTLNRLYRLPKRRTSGATGGRDAGRNMHNLMRKNERSLNIDGISAYGEYCKMNF